MEKTNKYWAERLAKAQDNVSQKTRKQIEKQLRKYYKSAAKGIMNDFEATLNKLYATVEGGRKPTPADLYKLDTYWQMQSQTREQLRKLGERQVTKLTKEFERDFFEVYFTLRLDGMEEFSTIDTAAVEQIINQVWCADGKSWSQRVWDNTNQLREELNEQLVHAVVVGKPSSYLKKHLMERFNVSYNNADMLVRTELAHIQTQAAQHRYRDYGLQQVEVLADKDERRCDVCGKLHKKRYNINDVMPVPAHPRCRCCIVPVVED